jgi:uncharacterized membrane protein
VAGPYYTLAIKVSVVPTDLFVRKGTPAEAFRVPEIGDFEPINREGFLKALQQVKLVIDELIANAL